MPKLKFFPNGAWTFIDAPSFAGGMYHVKAYDPAGNVIDSIRCDTYRSAREYLRAFNALAKATK
jgi:hypothetical protein